MADIECLSVELSDEQRANLAKLAAYLWTLPADYPDFEMSDFITSKNGEVTRQERRLAHVPVCGTAACAAGHGPRAGIAPEEGEFWHTYSRRAFVEGDEGWEWCFGAGWHWVDNTVHGAAARIEFMLANGVPFNQDDQRWGDADLCYTTDRAVSA